jgi:hypothetical protein
MLQVRATEIVVVVVAAAAAAGVVVVVVVVVMPLVPADEVDKCLR